MVKKIIDVPYSTDFIYVNYGAVTSTGGLTSFSSARYIPSELEDAPTVAENTTVEKRVIELPADVIEDVNNVLKTSKDNGEESVFGFLLNASDVNLANDVSYDILADWFLHPELVEFVPKPSKKYYVQTDLGVVVNNEYNEGNINLLNYNVPKHRVIMAEEEADEFVDELEMLNARKVEVED